MSSLSWSVYFDEDELNSEAESLAVEQAVSSFRMRNGKEPNALEVAHIKQFLSVPNELCSEQDTPLGLTASSVKSSKFGQAASWSTFFDDGNAKGSVKNAARAFEAVHGRQPTSFELDRIRSFLATPSQQQPVPSSAGFKWDSTATRPAVVQVN